MDTVPEFDPIDTMIDELSRVQFSVLSDISCGKAESDIRHQQELSSHDFHDVLVAILEVMDVDNIQSAVNHYGRWIDEFESKCNETAW